MALGWQDIAAVAVVLCACGYLLHCTRRVLFSRQQRTCGGCAGCTADSVRQAEGFVPLNAIAMENATKK